jgi:hypothetical protein
LDIVRQSKWLVAGSFAFAALWKRDAEIMWAMMGAVVNTMLSSILKICSAMKGQRRLCDLILGCHHPMPNPFSMLQCF